MSQPQLKIQGTDACNLDHLNGGKKTELGNFPSIKLPKGSYYAQVTYSDVHFAKSLNRPVFQVNEVIIFNTASVKTNNPYGWYSTANKTDRTLIEAETDQPIYLALLDHIRAGDNTGHLIVTFSPVD